MKCSCIFLTLTVVAYAANDDAFEQWAGPKDGDVRGPCPFMNAFANHGFLPRSGKYITEENMIDGLSRAVNFDTDLTKTMFGFSLLTNPEPNSSWFSLDHLARHNVLEHDASLSRKDAYFGHAEIFDQETFDETRSYWGGTIDAETGVDAFVARLATSNATNPNYSLSKRGSDFLIGETGAFILVLGDADTMTANKSVVEYLFQNERLPTELGWTRSEEPLTQDMLQNSMTVVRKEYEKRANDTSMGDTGSSYEPRRPRFH